MEEVKRGEAKGVRRVRIKRTKRKLVIFIWI
jgi:hypothetical protein